MLDVERWTLKRLGKLEGEAPVRPSEPDPAAKLFCFLDRLNDLVKIRPLACLEFGMEQFAIGPNFDGAAVGGNQRK